MTLIMWEFVCQICRTARPDNKISVLTRDVGPQLGLKPGIVQENVRYCNDNPECAEKAKTFTLLKAAE